MAIKSLKSGAFEFLEKPFDEERLMNFVKRAVENFKLKNENKKLFHAGTTFNSKKEIIASGGRVINATVCSNSLKQARKIALGMLKKINWKNKYYRKDIGYKVIK